MSGCKAKQRVVNQEKIERISIDTLRVPVERTVLTGTLSYIPEQGITFTEIEQKNTTGIKSTVFISGDTLKVVAETEEKLLPVVTHTVTETQTIQQEEKTPIAKTWNYICYIIAGIAIILLLSFLLGIIKK